jgi:ABC-type antimicrobial peptide transport system permease subunit
VLLVRPRGEAAGATNSVRRTFQNAVPNLPYVSINPLETLVSPQKRSWQVGATMFTALGCLALLLAAVGLYSVLAYDVAQRTREIGVRVAMGARAADVMGLVVTRGVRTAIVGGVIGTALATAAGPWVAPLLFQTSPRDPAVIGVVILGVVVVAIAAALVPARRALSVDPIEALKAD